MKLMLVIILTCGFVQSDQIYNELAQFCSQNGLLYISLATTSSIDLKNEGMQAMIALEKQGLRARELSYNELDLILDFNLDTFVLLAHKKLLQDPIQFRKYLERIGEHKIRKSVLVMTELMTQDEELSLKSLLDELMNENAFFYMLYQVTDNPTAFKQVLSLKNNTKTLIQELQFDSQGKMIEDFNLEGLQIVSYTLSWAPYFIIENCNEFGQECEISGFLSDYMDALGRILNFTWTSHRPVDGSWGVRPISGPYNKSGIWSGAMGEVVNGNFHISLSQWIWNIDRYGLLDFVSTSVNYQVLALTPQPPEVDTGLFIRPFRQVTHLKGTLLLRGNGGRILLLEVDLMGGVNF